MLIYVKNEIFFIFVKCLTKRIDSGPSNDTIEKAKL